MPVASTDHVSLKPSQLAQALEICAKARRPALVWGRRGIGKSALVHQLAQRLQGQLVDFRGSLMDPVDLRGLPEIIKHITTWARPAFFPVDGTGILLLDEINRASPMMLNALLQLTLDRRIAEHVLGDGWAIVACANPSGRGLATMDDAHLSRFIQLWLEPELLDWRGWAYQNGIDPVVIGFASFRPEIAMENPRGLEFVDQVVVKAKAPAELALALAGGTLGHEVAIEFLAFRQVVDSLPNLDGILTNPDNEPVPPTSQPATLYAVAAGLATRASERNWGRVMRYLDRMPSEYSVFAVQSSTCRLPALRQTAEYTGWACAHPELF